MYAVALGWEKPALCAKQARPAEGTGSNDFRLANIYMHILTDQVCPSGDFEEYQAVAEKGPICKKLRLT